MIRRRTLLGGGAALVPSVAQAACDTSRWRKILNSMAPEAQACGAHVPVFFDTFNTLNLYNTRNVAAGGTWQPAGTFGSFIDGSDANQVWVVNPFNPNTPYNNVYTATNSILSMRIDNSPDSTKTGGDTLIGGRLHTFNTFQHAVQGYWEINVAAPVLPGSLFSFWLNDQTGAQQINVCEIVAYPDLSHSSGFAVWTPATNSVANTFYTYQMPVPIDTSGFHFYGVFVSSTQVSLYIDRALVVTFPLPAGYTNPMFIFMDWFAGGTAQGNGFITSPVANPAFVQIPQVGYWSSRPF